VNNKTASTTDENKALVRHFFELLRTTTWMSLKKMVAEDYDDHLAGQHWEIPDFMTLIKQIQA